MFLPFCCPFALLYFPFPLIVLCICCPFSSCYPLALPLLSLLFPLAHFGAISDGKRLYISTCIVSPDRLIIGTQHILNIVLYFAMLRGMHQDHKNSFFYNPIFFNVPVFLLTIHFTKTYFNVMKWDKWVVFWVRCTVRNAKLVRGQHLNVMKLKTRIF